MDAPLWSGRTDAHHTWYRNSLSGSEKKAYTSAVNCLLTRPSKLRGDFAPGARNRYDDFVAAHINQTLSIHATGNFLTWHRYYVWAYENALREECGYDGYQPVSESGIPSTNGLWSFD